MDYNDKRLNPARSMGFLSTEFGWQQTFQGAFLMRYPSGTTVLRMLARAAETSHSDLSWSHITDSTLRSFMAILDDSHVCTTSARTYCSQLKAVLNAYNGEELFPSRKYADILSVRNQPSQQVFLTDSEIERISRYTPRNARERYVRNVFLIQCYTGCRHSDAVNLTEENISDGWLTYVSQKTKRESSVPVHPMLPTLMSELRHYCQPVCDSAFNDCIRRICQRVGINEQVKLFRKGREMTGEKWQFVASHTGRRSTASDLYLHGVDVYSISQILGHSGTAMTERYICSKRELSEKAMSFFGT